MSTIKTFRKSFLLLSALAITGASPILAQSGELGVRLTPMVGKFLPVQNLPVVIIHDTLHSAELKPAWIAGLDLTVDTPLRWLALNGTLLIGRPDLTVRSRTFYTAETTVTILSVGASIHGPTVGGLEPSLLFGGGGKWYTFEPLAVDGQQTEPFDDSYADPAMYLGAELSREFQRFSVDIRGMYFQSMFETDDAASATSAHQSSSIQRDFVITLGIGIPVLES